MMKRLFTAAAWAIAVLVMPVGLPAFPARADVYDIDPEHAEVRFSWNHLGLSRQSGRFTDVRGTLTFEPGRPTASAVEVTIPLSGIQTGVKKLDEHLLTSRDFFDVTAHPAITFKSLSVTPTSEKTAEVTGNLTINGVSRPVVLEVIWNFSGEHPLSTINPTYAGVYASGFSAKTQILRSDWGLTRTIPYVSDELRITIEAEFLRRSLPVPRDPASSAEQVIPAPSAAPQTAAPLPPPIPGAPLERVPSVVDEGPLPPPVQ